MSARRRQRLAVLIGAVLVVGHGAALPWLLRSMARDPLRVVIDAPPYTAGPTLDVSADVPPGVRSRTSLWIDGTRRGPASRLAEIAADPIEPGMHWIEWWTRYLGEIDRRVGFAQMVGPFQDPRRPPCSVRILFGQRLLDDGKASPGTVAHLVGELAARELAGTEQLGIGSFQRIDHTRLSWVGGEGGQRGHLRANIRVRFDRMSIELIVVLRPRLQDGRLELDAKTDVRLDLHNRLATWLVRAVRADKLVARLVRNQVSPLLDRLIAVPPPIPLGDGTKIELTFCSDRPVEFVTGSHAGLWLAIRLDEARPAAHPGPVLLAPSFDAEPVALTSPLAIDVDGNALNAVLWIMWRSGYLERKLIQSGIVDRVHHDETVRSLLSLRVRGPTLPFAPAVSAATNSRSSYALGAVSEFVIEDGELATPARLFARAELSLIGDMAARAELSQLGFACRPEPHVLLPCYPDIVSQLRTRAPELHDTLSDWLTDMLERLLLGRQLGAPGALGRLTVQSSRVVPPPAGQHGPLRVEIVGQVTE